MDLNFRNLAPCPFCGSTPDTWTEESQGCGVNVVSLRETNSKKHYVVQCHCCATVIGFTLHTGYVFDTPEKAIEAWNTRGINTREPFYSLSDDYKTPSIKKGGVKYE